VRRNYAALTVGLTALVVSMVSFVVFKYTNESVPQGYQVHALFRDALGLTEKSRVLTAGIEIGQIVTKELDQETARAIVTLRIKPTIKLYDNAVVMKKSASLLGEFYLEIDPGTPFANVNGQRVPVGQIPPGGEIKNVVEQGKVSDVIDSVQQTLPILQDILRDVRTLTAGPISEMANNLNGIVARNSEVLDRLLARIDNIAAHIEGVTTAESEDVKVSLKNVREITEGLKSLVGKTEGTVGATGEDLRSSMAKIQRSVDTLQRSLENVEKITDRVASGEGTVGRLVNNDTTARNIENITEDAGQFVRSITRLQTIVGVRSEYNFLANSLKHYVSVSLMPRPDKFYLIEIVDDPRGYRTETRTVRDSSKNGPDSVTEVQISEKLRFSFQLGKRIGPVTGRFGIKESTGGAGLDLHLLADRLTLSVDVFDTRSNIYPRVQARGWLNVFNNVWIVGGADDLANYTRGTAGSGSFFDWFLGGSLIFNDQDLKSLLLFGGGSVTSAANR
jgi:phospholipid/cholesterol/gamma-HCH transport system substrate-binding protein